ncbi:MAG: RagB/SusD family nutrient uptake outer membrane protein [Bacteroidetes bacterium]|nr:RagB/SusD family nutrient uptake outer membrane protein [Bacteroidota bacterium]
MKKNISWFCVLVIIGLSACKKWIIVAPPSNEITANNVFTDSNLVLASLLNIYSKFDKEIEPSITPFLGLYTDELGYASGDLGTLEFLNANLSATNSRVYNIWQRLFSAIYQCNDLINQIKPTEGISEQTVSAYMGEAKFLRAYSYFYLVNLFGPVPLLLTTDVKANALLHRADTAAVYVQIEKDLQEAERLLPTNYRGRGRVRANSMAATAMLARVHLYQRRWAEAESKASELIGDVQYTALPSLSNCFLASGNRSILQFWTQYGYAASAPLLIPKSGTPTYFIIDSLYKGFEKGDQRLSTWLGISKVGANTFYYAFKYHNRTNNTSSPEFLICLRIAEQYLIRSEARLAQNNLIGASEDLNMVRNRAGLENTEANTHSEIMDAILQERRVELFVEWGHRFFDLKRLGKLAETMRATKPSWLPKSALFPIPSLEIDKNPNLTQNSGY